MKQDRLHSARPRAKHPAAAAKTKPTEWARFKAFAKGVGAAIVSLVTVAALWISILTYRDQHQAAVQANMASARTYATQVSFWLIRGRGNADPQLVIRNGSSGPITDVWAAVDVHSRHGDPQSIDEFDQPVSLAVGSIPPCSVITTNALEAAQENVQNEGTDVHEVSPPNVLLHVKVKYSAAYFEGITFKDVDGVPWSRSAYGTLLSGDYFGGGGPEDPAITRTGAGAANGCP